MSAHSLGSTEVAVALAAGTKIGPHHAQSGTPNQDAYDYIEGPGLVTLAVADGAGSLEYSKEGAEMAVEAAVGMSADLIIQSSGPVDLVEVLKESMLEARNAVKTHPQWERAGCTLTLAAITEEYFAVGVVGDSFAVLQTADSALHLVQPPSVGEFANITKLLTSDDFTYSIVSGSTKDLLSIALCSDAFEQATLEKRVPTAGFWSKIFAMAFAGSLSIEQLIGFMDAQGKIEDDATMIVGTVSKPESDTDHSDAPVSLTVQEFTLREIQGGVTKSVTDDALSSADNPEESSSDSDYIVESSNWKKEWNSLDSPRGLPTTF